MHARSAGEIRLLPGNLIVRRNAPSVNVTRVSAELSRGCRLDYERAYDAQRHVRQQPHRVVPHARHSRIVLVAHGSSLSLTQFKPHPP